MTHYIRLKSVYLRQTIVDFIPQLLVSDTACVLVHQLTR